MQPWQTTFRGTPIPQILVDVAPDDRFGHPVPREFPFPPGIICYNIPLRCRSIPATAMSKRNSWREISMSTAQRASRSGRRSGEQQLVGVAQEMLRYKWQDCDMNQYPMSSKASLPIVWGAVSHISLTSLVATSGTDVACPPHTVHTLPGNNFHRPGGVTSVIRHDTEARRVDEDCDSEQFFCAAAIHRF